MNIDGTGTKAEVVAKRYLEEKGFRIIEENYNVPKVGEIDLIALDGRDLVFVEVRYRQNLDYGHPLETVGKRKQQTLICAAGSYLSECKASYENVRFDVIGILGEKLEHIKDAFWARWS